jgi:hypothetical protein
MKRLFAVLLTLLALAGGGAGTAAADPGPGGLEPLSIGPPWGGADDVNT